MRRVLYVCIATSRLRDARTKYCCAEHHKIANREAPRAYDDRLRELATLGHSYSYIAKACGVDKHRLMNRAISLGIVKAAARTGKPPAYLPAQEEILRRMYPSGADFDQIEPLVNAVPGGYRLRDKKQLWAWAKARKIVRSARYLSDRCRQQARNYWDRRKVEAPVVDLTRQPIAIPLREVYARGFTLELPRAKRGDLAALNAAVKRDDPAHPGFCLADRKLSRIGLYGT